MGYKLLMLLMIVVSTTSYSLTYDRAFNVLMKYEGVEYHDNPRDPGGPTKFGWTLKSYQETITQKASKKTIQTLRRGKAKALYRKYWWCKYGASRISDPELAITVFLAQVNMGAYRPNKVLQVVSNDLCDTNLKPDGVLGSQSIKAINSCNRIEGAFPYYLHLTYINDHKIDPVWQWAKKGLRNRIFHFEDME